MHHFPTTRVWIYPYLNTPIASPSTEIFQIPSKASHFLVVMCLLKVIFLLPWDSSPLNSPAFGRNLVYVMFSNHPIFFVTKHPCCLERFGSAFQTHPEPTNPCWPQLAANSQEPSSSNEDALDSEANPAGLESGPGGILILPVGFLFSRWCVSWICVCVVFQFRRK